MTTPPRTPEDCELHGRAIEVVRRQSDGTWRYVVDDPYAEFS